MKITITFELEVSDKITETQKTQIIHKIDECIDQLGSAEIISKRTIVAFPFHVHGYSFNGGRLQCKSNAAKEFEEEFKRQSNSDFKREYFNNPVEEKNPFKNDSFEFVKRGGICKK